MQRAGQVLLFVFFARQYFDNVSSGGLKAPEPLAIDGSRHGLK